MKILLHFLLKSSTSEKPIYESKWHVPKMKTEMTFQQKQKKKKTVKVIEIFI